MTPYRDLTIEEQEALFSIYRKYKGIACVMAKAEDCPYKNRKQIGYYRDKYDFKAKLAQIITEETNNDVDDMRTRLLAGKKRAIEKAMSLLESKKVTAKSVKIVWEIIKVELGEPTNINQNNNNNESDNETLDKIRNDISKIIKHVKAGTAKVNTGGESGMPIPA